MAQLNSALLMSQRMPILKGNGLAPGMETFCAATSNGLPAAIYEAEV